MSAETASILSFATNGALAPAKLAVPFPKLTTSSSSSATTQSRAQQAIDTVKQANANWRGLRKSMAGFRLQYAQATLKALMFFGGDPATVTKRAAQLAREVRAAAQDYVAAGGDAADLPVTAQSTPGATSPTPTSTVLTTPMPVADSGGFVDEARAIVDGLKAAVARSHQAAQTRHRGQAGFDEAAQGADAAIDQVSGSTTVSTFSFNLLI